MVRGIMQSYWSCRRWAWLQNAWQGLRMHQNLSKSEVAPAHWVFVWAETCISADTLVLRLQCGSCSGLFLLTTCRIVFWNTAMVRSQALLSVSTQTQGQAFVWLEKSAVCQSELWAVLSVSLAMRASWSCFARIRDASWTFSLCLHSTALNSVMPWHTDFRMLWTHSLVR